VDFELDDDQLELQRVARDVVERECPPTLVRAVVDGSADGDDFWKTLVSLDWPSLTVPADDGGMGMSAVELAIVLEELGAVADPTPFLATTSQYVALVQECADDAQRRALLGAVCEGTTGTVAFAGDESADEAVRATRDGDGWRLDGAARHVLDGDRADEIAVVAQVAGGADDGADAVGVFVVPAGAATATRTTTFDGSLHLADVRLDGVHVGPGRALAGDGLAGGVVRARQEATTGLAATMVGASRRILDLVLAHVRERHQFGVPIGSFQAVKHMAVDVFVAVERARALVHFAALTIAEDDHPPDPTLPPDEASAAPSQLPGGRALATAMAKAAAGDAQRLAVQNGIQLFGGLGFTWENDLQIYVRRAKVGELLLGGSPAHRAQAATLGGLVASPTVTDLGSGEVGAQPRRGSRGRSPRVGGMSLHFDERTEAFRREFEAWLDENAPDPATTAERPRSSSHIPPWAQEWQRRQFDAGWLVPGNPPEYGGRNATLLEQFVHLETLGRRRIYHSYNPQGLAIIAPSILGFGTEEQKRRWARRILRAEVTASLGMSEPDAGSDLAGLRTRAVLDGDRFVINGQKVWTSGAHDADVILAFVRTDPDAPKHKGISVLLVPTDTPGLTRRPFGSIVAPDDLDFNEVFFDDVEVPVENLVGELHDGWRVATGSLGHERAMIWLTFAERLDDLVSQGSRTLAEHGLASDPLVRDWFGKVVVDRYAVRLLGYRTLAKARRGTAGPEQSILKLFSSEAVQDATLRVMESLGPDALDPTVRSAPHAPLHSDDLTQSWFNRYLRSFGATIAGGTSQIQRNIVAERVLGLPR
jgi:alkylation response protein AidB-like acyl-CoA dehydrogenase